MINILELANEADVIIRGFAVQQIEDGIRVVNLNSDGDVAMFTSDGMLIETNMDEIELTIAKDCMNSAMKYLED